MKRSITSLATASLLVGLMASPVAAVDPTTTGTWAQYPTSSTSYFAEVQQPINSANTSNWSVKSKGGIPIMYKLFEQSGPAVFESIYSDDATDATSPTVPCAGGHLNNCAIAQFTPLQSLTFDDITNLSTIYDFTLGDCHGGSLRWTIRVLHDFGDGFGLVPTSVHVYYGNPNNSPIPPGQSCIGAYSGSGDNLITTGIDPNRFEVQGLAGPTYISYADAQAVVGTDEVLRVSLIIDSGWGGDQRLVISDTTVNDNAYQWNAGGSGTLTPTCDLPDALIDVTGVDTTPTGAVNEGTVYPAAFTDTADQFRVVDCKYQYILSIPSLHGVGTYDVEILIDGVEVPTGGTSEVAFDLK